MNKFLAEIGKEVKESGLAIATDGFSAPHRIAIKQSNSMSAPEGMTDGAFYGKNTGLLPGAALYAVIQETVDGKCLMNSVIKVGVSHVYCACDEIHAGRGVGHPYEYNKEKGFWEAQEIGYACERCQKNKIRDQQQPPDERAFPQDAGAWCKSNKTWSLIMINDLSNINAATVMPATLSVQSGVFTSAYRKLNAPVKNSRIPAQDADDRYRSWQGFLDQLRVYGADWRHMIVEITTQPLTFSTGAAYVPLFRPVFGEGIASGKRRVYEPIEEIKRTVLGNMLAIGEGHMADLHALTGEVDEAAIPAAPAFSGKPRHTDIDVAQMHQAELV